ncbi:MAG: U32 family peptidase [Bacteroides sp.]|nr:U32 family peptidase [Bacteroides sp.]
MKKARPIELLAPARNLECGIEAVNHGADAVYIGAPKFGARAAAGNSLQDIAALVQYAHCYNVRVYVALNTILRDDELAETEHLIHQLYRIGVDALIVQDMGITRLSLPPIPLHASTQADNRTPQKVTFLAKAGFRQVVLARELTLQEIADIHQATPDTRLEVFVHGALCVSYSGQCYVSEACFGRSANRGECAQFCRLAFNMTDADGRVMAAGKHLLSLRDLNRSDSLEQLLDAGAASLKIEGRLKETSYVKNVTAYYRQRLDAILRRRPEYVRASSGSCRYTFTPQPEKSFSRGFTPYFLHGRTPDIASPDSPKSLGEFMGTLKEHRGSYITVAGLKSFHNGDGLCFMDEQGKLQGFRVNRVEGNRLYAAGPMPRIRQRTPLYRNHDQEFERLLSRPSAERRIALSWHLAETPRGFALTATDEDDNRVTLAFDCEKQTARTPQNDHVVSQLSKLGNTPFEVTTVSSPLNGRRQPAVEIAFATPRFLPASQLADWRRKVIERLLSARRMTHRRELSSWPATTHPYPQEELTYLGNVMNSHAEEFYRLHGVKRLAPAYEARHVEGVPLMFCKHCLRYSMGWCPRQGREASPYREPYVLQTSDGRRFRLEFDCRNCQMKLYKEEP